MHWRAHQDQIASTVSSKFIAYGNTSYTVQSGIDKARFLSKLTYELDKLHMAAINMRKQTLYLIQQQQGWMKPEAHTRCKNLVKSYYCPQNSFVQRFTRHFIL